jgi:hypothetical protein
MAKTDTSPIYYQDAKALAALIRTMQLSSREVVQTHDLRLAGTNLLHAKGLTSDAVQRAFNEKVQITKVLLPLSPTFLLPNHKGDRQDFQTA